MGGLPTPGRGSYDRRRPRRSGPKDCRSWPSWLPPKLKIHHFRGFSTDFTVKIGHVHPLRASSLRLQSIPSSLTPDLRLSSPPRIFDILDLLLQLLSRKWLYLIICIRRLHICIYTYLLIYYCCDYYIYISLLLLFFLSPFLAIGASHAQEAVLILPLPRFLATPGVLDELILLLRVHLPLLMLLDLPGVASRPDLARALEPTNRTDQCHVYTI